MYITIINLQEYSMSGRALDVFDVVFNTKNFKLDRLFDDMWSSYSNKPHRVFNETVPADVKKVNDDIHVILDTTGFSKDDISVEVEEGKLVISGKRTEENVEYLQKQIYRKESFKNEYRLKDFYDVDKMSATWENGYLKVVIPVNIKKAEKRLIPIK